MLPQMAADAVRHGSARVHAARPLLLLLLRLHDQHLNCAQYALYAVAQLLVEFESQQG